ncbi:MAG: hypothetical protein RJB61_251 [Actinomycetota bacterium]
MSFLHDVEPALAETDEMLHRIAAEWEQHMLPLLARLEGSTFADEAASTLRTWMSTASAVETTDHLPNPADSLFLQMLDDAGNPSRAAAFVLRAADDPALLFDSAADWRLAQRVAMVGVEALSPADAERAVLGFIGWFRHYELTHNPIDESYQHEWRRFLVALITPWTLHFAPLHSEWTSTAEERAALLSFVVRDIESLEWLLIGAERVVEEVADAVTRSTSDLALVELLGSYLGLLGGLAVGVRRAAAADQLVVWHRLWIVAGTVAGAVAGAVSGSALAPSAAKATVTVAERLSQPFRPDPARAASDAEYAHRATLVLAADAIATATVAQWRAHGILPADTRPPPTPDADASDPLTDYVQRFISWRSRLPGGADGDPAVRLTALVWSVLGPEEAGRSTAQLAI